MSIRASQSRNHLILTPTGSSLAGIDRAELRNLIDEEIEAGIRQVILDCTGLSHISSTGLGVVVACHVALAKTGGAFYLAGASGRVKHCLKITGLLEVFECFDTLEKAQTFVKARKKKSQEEK